jgi:ABC-type transporter Mla MlaB component
MRTFKLEQGRDKGKIVITLEGELAGEYVPVVEAYMKNLLATHSPLVFRMQNISVIDQAGLNLLQFFVDHGVLFQGSDVSTSFRLDRTRCRPRLKTQGQGWIRT